ncbi:hypothetical protein CSB20_05270 [bacterium DOLZORAL124_64_63]|nr:MAG: hypothetical protein CSB20_05270 [bacterium DOLZORAL124_64_63]
MKGLSLRTIILSWLLVVSLTPVLLLGLAWHHHARESRFEFARRELQNVSELQRKDGELFSERLQEVASRGVAGKAPLRALRLGGREALDYLQDVRRIWGLGEVLLLDREGLPLAWAHTRDVWVRGEETSPTWDPDLMRLAHESLASGLGVSRSFDHDNRKRAMLAQPIRDEKMALKGMLVVAVELSELLEALRHSGQLAPGASTRLVSHQGEVLAVLGGRAAGLHAAPEALLGTMTGERIIRYDDPLEGTYLSITRHMEFLGQPYTLMTTLSEADATAGMETMELGLLGIVLLVVMAALLGGWFISRRMVKPLDQLGESMGRVADGHDLHSLPRQGPPEVMNLIEVFKMMMARLEEARRLNEQQFAMKRDQVRLNEALGGASSVKETARLALDFLQENLAAVIGAFYLVEQDGGVETAASFGIPQAQPMTGSLVEDGVLGYALRKARVVVVRDLDRERTWLRTGMLEVPVNNLVLIPVQFGGQNLGIIELGLQDRLEDHQRDFLNLVRETVAVAINAGRSRDRVNRLLRETWVQAETLSRHQKELHETNRELARADRYKSEFLANMSHELRTPLNSVLIMAQVLAENRNGGLSREEVESACTIRKAGEDLLLLINDVLDLSKVEAGKMDINIAALRPADTLREMDELFRPLALDKGLDWEVRAEAGIPEKISTDSLRLNQILRNILNNAIKFTAEGRVAMVLRMASAEEMWQQDLGEAGEGLVFEIRDTGIGMKPEVVQHLFNSFEQGDGSIGRRFGGSGLGLAISQRLALILGGAITVHSQDGQGSTFRLFLPLSGASGDGEDGPQMVSWSASADGEEVPAQQEREKEEQPEPEPEPIQILDVQGRDILLCEDDMRTVFSLTDQLEEAGARVHLARSWREGLDLLGAQEGRDVAMDVVILSPDVADAPRDRDLAPWREKGVGARVPLLVLGPYSATGKYEIASGCLERPVCPRKLIRMLNGVLDGKLDDAPMAQTPIAQTPIAQTPIAKPPVGAEVLS